MTTIWITVGGGESKTVNSYSTAERRYRSCCCFSFVVCVRMRCGSVDGFADRLFVVVVDGVLGLHCCECFLFVFANPLLLSRPVVMIRNYDVEKSISSIDQTYLSPSVRRPRRDT